MTDPKTAAQPPPGAITQERVAEDFDRVTDDYAAQVESAIAFCGQEHQFYIDVKRDHIVRLAKQHFGSVENLSVLDLGCGIGTYHQGLKGTFADLHGVDVSERSIEAARGKHDFVAYQAYDGHHLPFDDNVFDVAFTVCVMHHVPPPQWPAFTREMYRVLKPGGLALVFEHNPYNPLTRYVVRSCAFDKDAVLLRPRELRKLFSGAEFENVSTRTILSVPPIGAALGRIDRVCGVLPLGAQYYLRAAKPIGVAS